MRKRKQEIKEWDNKIMELFAIEPDTKLTENRLRTMRYLLIQKYSMICSDIEKESMLRLLKDILFLDRRLRLFTEGLQVDKKELLSHEYIVEQLQ